MDDFSHLSDDDLQKLSAQYAAKPSQKSALDDFSYLSDADLEKMAAQNAHQKPKSQEIPAYKGYPAAMLRGLARDIPFAQDIGAGLKALPDAFSGHYGERFAHEKERQKAVDDALAEQYPATTYGSQIAGAFALPIAGPANRVASGLAPILGGTAARSLGLGVVGAGYGGLYGAGEGDSLGERAHNAGIGALTGGVAGAALPALMEGAGKLAKGAVNRLGFGNAEELASKDLQEALERAQKAGDTGMSAGDVSAAQGRGEPVLPIDVGGAGVRQMAKAAGHSTPEAMGILRGKLGERAKEQAGRFSDFVKGMMGHDLNDQTVLDSLHEAAKNVNNPAYTAAMADGAGGVWSKRLGELINHDWVKRAIPQAIEEGNIERIKKGLPRAKSPFIEDEHGNLKLPVDKDGNTVYPTLEFWDTIKKNIDGITRSAKPTPLNGGDANTYRLGSDIKNMLVGELDRIVPSYKEAREGASRFFGAENAYRAGNSFLGLTKSINVNAAKKAINSYSPEERELFAHGLMSDLLQKMQNKNDSQNLARMFNNPSVREKLNLALGSNRANLLEAYARREDIMDRSFKHLFGSDTAPNAMAMARSAIEHGGGTLAGGLAGAVEGYQRNGLDPLQIGKDAVIGAIAGHLGGKALHMGSQRNVELARKLVSDDPAVMQEALHAISGNPKAMEALRKAHSGVTAMTSQAGSKIGGKDRHHEPEPQYSLSYRADGGRVNKRDYPAKKQSKLEKQADRTLRALGGSMTPLMDMPDAVIAHALRVAKQ